MIESNLILKLISFFYFTLQPMLAPVAPSVLVGTLVVTTAKLFGISTASPPYLASAALFVDSG